GEPIEVMWTVTNFSDEPATGRWSDSVFFSTDAAWDIGDRAVGRIQFTGTLDPGESYTSTLQTTLPSLTPGLYRVIVRADIFNQVYEDVADANNTTASAGTVNVVARELQLGVVHETTLSTGQERLFQVTVPLDRTLRVKLNSSSDESSTELFLRHGAAPTSTAFDAASRGSLAADQVAIVPATKPGVYYILVRGFAMPESDTPVTVLAELVPLAISDVHTDRGGDSRYVTTTIEGARFHEDAIVKLVRPGFAEYEPVNYRVVNATKIIATFDLEGAPHGLYDLKVINPSGDAAVVPYRFLVERTIEPDVTIGLGGPRFIFAGDTGTYSVALQNLGNVDAPYTFFNVGIPELGIHQLLYNLPYVRFFSNLRGAPEGGDVEDLPWAELKSDVNLDGNVTAGGYLLDEPADGFTGFTFEVGTYLGLRELHDHAFEELKSKLYAAFPEHAEADTLAAGPEALDLIYPGLYFLWSVFGAIPSLLDIPLIPFQFHVVASSTTMTRDEFVEHSLEEAGRLRQAVLGDDTASPSLITLAADPNTWNNMYLASLEEAGLLRPDGIVPPVRENPKIISLMATLAGGILIGPAGEEILTTGSLNDFFQQVRVWYGHDPDAIAEYDPDPPGFTGDSLSFFGLLQNANPTAVFPTFDDYDLGLSTRTHFQAFRVYVPWVPFEKRGAGIPAEYQVTGITPDNENAFFPLNLEPYYDSPSADAGAASMTGPFTVESSGFVPAEEPLPFTVHFQNDPASSSHTSEIRVVTPLDPNLDARSFRLGDLKVGDITVHIPNSRSLFQGDFDFTDSLGFLLRVSAGVDLKTSSATWLLQAIDPLTGELVQDPNVGLLPPNNAQGQGAGFVSYSMVPSEEAETGAEITATARVLMNNVPPEDTPSLTYKLDAQAPASEVAVEPLGNADFLVHWNVADDEGGSGFKHVTLYVAEDGGDFKIWKRQLTESVGEEAYLGRVGHTYEFLALATDRAGNREVPPVGSNAEDDGSQANLGSLPSVGETTLPNFGQPPAPTVEPSTYHLFTQAEVGIPSDPPASNASEFDTVIQPFEARSFGTGFVESHAGIGPMAIAETPGGMFLISGGPARNQLFLFEETGGAAEEVWAELPYPIFGLTFDPQGRLWATTGGGPLLELDPQTGDIIASHGDGLTMAIAVEPDTGDIYVSSGNGVEVFDPDTGRFSHFSRDLDLRVGSLAFAPDGKLWATTWPDRQQVIRFTDRRRAETMLSFDTPIDSLAFGLPGTSLGDLLFVSHNAGLEDEGSDLTMVDLATLRRVAVARGGTRGDVVIATSDGRVLLSQSSQVDVLNPIQAPVVVATNPPHQSIAALPLSLITVTYDQDMFVGAGTEAGSVINPANYLLTVNSEQVAISRLNYDAGSRTALLHIQGLEPGEVTLTIGEAILGQGGFALGSPYQVGFTAVSEFSTFVDIQFTGSRLNVAQLMP
ncbi:MAG: hypothetical protein JJ992_04105, partial [Planctomycetes bacterium]|nr:hypothetical protein [Planctomycetota bacterium]